MYQYLCLISAALYLIGNYPQWRDGAFIVSRDAASLLRWLSWRTAADVPAKSTAKSQCFGSIWAPTGASDLTPRTRALFTMGSIIAESYKTYQGSQTEHHLGDIAKELAITNDLQIMDGVGAGGFARIVRDFVTLKIREYSHDGHEHRFFVFHPDTAWRGAFLRLEDTEGSLPPQFAGIGHDLFVLCRWMLCVRVALFEAMGDEGKKVQFHLLIPAYEPLVIPRPFRFLTALYPLTVDGAISRGRKLVWMRVVSGSRGMLRDVGAIPPPCYFRAERRAGIAAFGTYFVTCPALIAAGAFICSSTTPLAAALPLALTIQVWSLAVPIWVAKLVRDHCLYEELPAILG